jgi:hypothetical protein
LVIPPFAKKNGEGIIKNKGNLKYKEQRKKGGITKNIVKKRGIN